MELLFVTTEDIRRNATKGSEKSMVGSGGKATSFSTIVDRILLSHTLGHREVMILFQHHNRANLEVMKSWASEVSKRVEGCVLKSGLLISDINQAKTKGYDAIVAPSRREFFESRIVTHILNPERSYRDDFIHHRNSGLNQVLLKLARGEKKRLPKTIISTFSQLLNSKRESVILGRMRQNVKWCDKYGVLYSLVSGASSWYEIRGEKDLKQFKRVLLEI